MPPLGLHTTHAPKVSGSREEGLENAATAERRGEKNLDFSTGTP